MGEGVGFKSRCCEYDCNSQPPRLVQNLRRTYAASNNENSVEEGIPDSFLYISIEHFCHL